MSVISPGTEVPAFTLKREDGTLRELHERWILGRQARSAGPRWSVIRDVLSLITVRGLPDGVSIETDLSVDLLKVSASPDQMLRVIQNLCENALHAMTERGGLLKVETDNV